MRGLIEKDLRLTLHKKQTLIIFLVVAMIMGFSVDGTFIIGYLTMLSAIVSIGTLSYDEYDNGYAFLMTLPVDRKTYVKEKYLFCLGMSAAGWCLSVVLYFAGELVHGTSVSPADEFPMILSLLPLMFLVASFMIPLQLKYGAEKSRVVLFVLFGGMAVIVLTATKLVKVAGTDAVALIQFLRGLSPTVILFAIIAVCVILSFASFLWSVQIMQKKEF